MSILLVLVVSLDVFFDPSRETAFGKDSSHVDKPLPYHSRHRLWNVTKQVQFKSGFIIPSRTSKVELARTATKIFALNNMITKDGHYSGAMPTTRTSWLMVGSVINDSNFFQMDNANDALVNIVSGLDVSKVHYATVVCMIKVMSLTTLTILLSLIR